MKILRAVLLLALLFTLPGCLLVSRNPLSDPEDAAADPRLPGVWYGKSGADAIFLHFVADKGAMMDAVEVDHHDGGGADTHIYTAFPTVIDGTHYLNVKNKKGDTENYTLIRYHIARDGELTVWMMSQKPVERAVKSKKLAGRIKENDPVDDKPDSDVTLTASTEELAAFLRKSDPGTLFGEKFATFKKLALPSVEEGDSTPPPAAAHPVKRKKKKHASQGED